MQQPAVRKRIPAEERRELLLRVARRLFAERGFEGTKTSQIAEQAGVSEALLYRHFPSKEALYRSVLRETLREQDQMFDAVGMPDASTESLVDVIRNYLADAIATPRSQLREGARIMLGSIAGDGTHAAQVYRRAMRRQLPPLTEALQAAEANGDLDGRRIAPESVAMLVEHVGTMLAAGMALPDNGALYPRDRDALLDDATWFVARGIGLSTQAIERCLSGKTSALRRRKK